MLTHPTPEECEYPRWMDLKTAAWYSRIGQKRLKKLAEDSTITGYQDPDDGRGGWIFDRYSIDRYRQDKNPYRGIDEKCIAISSRFK